MRLLFKPIAGYSDDFEMYTYCDNYVFKSSQKYLDGVRVNLTWHLCV